MKTLTQIKPKFMSFICTHSESLLLLYTVVCMSESGNATSELAFGLKFPGVLFL